MSLSNGASVNYHILGESPTNLFKSNKVLKATVMATPSGPQGRRLWSLVPGPGPAHRFIAPSLPFPGKGDQAVDAHAARATSSNTLPSTSSSVSCRAAPSRKPPHSILCSIGLAMHSKKLLARSWLPLNLQVECSMRSNKRFSRRCVFRFFWRATGEKYDGRKCRRS